MNKNTLAFWIAALCLLAFNSQAQQNTCDTTRIYFVNGVWNDEEDALNSSHLIRDAYTNALEARYPGQTFEFKYAYNYSYGLVADILEYVGQKLNEINDPEASSWTPNQYFNLYTSGQDFQTRVPVAAQGMGALIDSYIAGRITESVDTSAHISHYQTDLDAGKRVLLIAHSQGNMFANQAIVALMGNYGDNIAMIGVASPAAQTYHTSTYYTAHDDLVINALRVIQDVLPSNIDNDPGIFNDFRNWSNHEFALSYFAASLASRSEIDFDVNYFMESLQFPNCSRLKIVDVPFADESFRSCVIDYAANDFLQWVYADEVTALACVDTDINNLEGLAAFTNLESLYLSGNNLNAVDISSLPKLKYFTAYKDNINSLTASNNAELTSLKIKNNNLTTIDVSNLAKLKTIEASGNNISHLTANNIPELISLDVSQNSLDSIDTSSFTKLRYFKAYDNNISNLDVSNNTELVELNISDNKLTNIDLNNLARLERFSASANNISSLDVSNNTELTHLGIGNNNIDSIDIGNLVKLELFNATNSNMVGWSKNNIRSLDVSNNTELAFLTIYDNKLNSIDVSNLVKLTYLVVSGNNLSSLDLSNNTELTVLSIGNNNLNSIDISNNTKLTSFYAANQMDGRLNQNNIGGIDVSHNTELTVLSIGNNNLNNIDISSNTKLRNLYVGDNNLNGLDVSNNPELARLDARFNPLSDQAMQYLFGLSIETVLYCTTDYSTITFPEPDYIIRCPYRG